MPVKRNCTVDRDPGHSPSADVAQGVASGPLPAVPRLISALFADVTRCRTKSVPRSGDAAGMSAQCHIVFVRANILH
jgi:hypothetical protein